ncbi:MAG: alpha/beta fold hydrolase BchO [Congregibacter sp.]
MVDAVETGQPPSDWPRKADSEFLQTADMLWHVQRSGAGPRLLLLHGTGASSHTWAPVSALLESRYEILAPDLPGQGFTQLASPQHCSLNGMSRALGVLLSQLSYQPDIIVGHSAGAAVAASLCLRGSCNPAAVVGINAAMLPFGRVAAPIFSRAARVLAALPVFPQVVALHAITRKPIERMLRQTGSESSEEMLRCYRTLMGKPRHVAGTLRMMANWDLPQLERNLARLEPALHLLTCSNDTVVSPEQGAELARRLPQATLSRAEGLGHLGHEEAPEWFAQQIDEIARQHEFAV